MTSGTRKERGLELLKIYCRAKRLGLLHRDLELTDQASNVQADAINVVLDEWRVDERTSTSDNAAGKGENRADAIENTQNSTTDIIIEDKLIENTKIQDEQQTGEEKEVEERGEYFELLLQLANEKQISSQLRKRNMELERRLRPSENLAISSKSRLEFRTLEEIGKQQETPIETKICSTSQRGSTVESLNDRTERKLRLSQGYITLLLEEISKLKTLLNQQERKK